MCWQKQHCLAAEGAFQTNKYKYNFLSHYINFFSITVTINVVDIKTIYKVNIYLNNNNSNNNNNNNDNKESKNPS